MKIDNTVKEYPQTDELVPPLGEDPTEFSETSAGYEAREKWSEWYDDLNGAPEGDWDR